MEKRGYNGLKYEGVIKDCNVVGRGYKGLKNGGEGLQRIDI
jgi:hypothetical protein